MTLSTLSAATVTPTATACPLRRSRCLSARSSRRAARCPCAGVRKNQVNIQAMPPPISAPHLRLSYRLTPPSQQEWQPKAPCPRHPARDEGARPPPGPGAASVSPSRRLAAVQCLFSSRGCAVLGDKVCDGGESLLHGRARRKEVVALWDFDDLHVSSRALCLPACKEGLQALRVLDGHVPIVLSVQEQQRHLQRRRHLVHAREARIRVDILLAELPGLRVGLRPVREEGFHAEALLGCLLQLLLLKVDRNRRGDVIDASQRPHALDAPWRVQVLSMRECNRQKGPGTHPTNKYACFGAPMLPHKGCDGLHVLEILHQSLPKELGRRVLHSLWLRAG
mmetsp:Transcript_6052/g.15419  ORF Transcript_6052/g.15419 Transcript_6052/m.15419 type:complete len:337 (-) Transcript_6052:462-1472(-)